MRKIETQGVPKGTDGFAVQSPTPGKLLKGKKGVFKDSFVYVNPPGAL